jgi:hypothetical protein
MSFVVAHVDHRLKLDLILLLHRRPGSIPVWIVASDLELTKAQVREMATQLARDGIVQLAGDKLELAPNSPELRLTIVDLATWCTIDRARVLHVLRMLGRST